MKASSDQDNDHFCEEIEKCFLVPPYFVGIQGEQ